MKLILSPFCRSLTGALESYSGYSIVHRKDGFYSQRAGNRPIPPDGFWYFIKVCAQLVPGHLYFTDIELQGDELIEALNQAGLLRDDMHLDPKRTYHATDVLTLKSRFCL